MKFALVLVLVHLATQLPLKPTLVVRFHNATSSALVSGNTSDVAAVLENLVVSANKTATEVCLRHSDQLGVLSAELFAPVADVQSVDFSRNSISFFESDAFEPLLQLLSLNLSRNLLERVEEDAFKDLVYLQVLDLSWNRIKSVALGAFLPTFSLKSVHLQHNLIQNLSLALASDELETLDLAGNLITTLEVEYVEVSHENFLTVTGCFDDSSTSRLLFNGTLFHLTNQSTCGTSTSVLAERQIGGNVEQYLWKIEQNLTDLMRITRDLQQKTNKAMLDLTWLRIANICSAVIVASCIVPTLVILCRTKSQ